MLVNSKDFLKKYEFLYFEPEESKREEYDKCENELDPVKKLNKTNRNVEKIIMDKLNNSVFDKDVFAWKSGKVKWENNKPVYSYYTNGYGHSVVKEELDSYCERIKKAEVKDRIIQEIENGNWGAAYEIAAEEMPPKEFGAVNIINVLFFISKGKAPIYDSFAHKAVKSLLFDIPPSEVYLGESPGRKDVKKARAMYIEYITLLGMVFDDINVKAGSNNEGGLIPRELDRALWVFGHSQKRHSEIYFE